jgi:predicted 3-demethylubiquinone-9 3-methyltransferase (glyoxalase superfamily)
MQKITPFLWFEKNIKEVLDFYVSVFPGTTSNRDGEINDTPSGTAQMATLKIFGTSIQIMTAGPYLPFAPTISFLISCDSVTEVESLWNTLIKTGKALMPLQAYPFAEKYGWVQDKYGVSWQFIFSSTMKASQKLIPTLMFAGEAAGRAQEAVNFYTSVFHTWMNILKKIENKSK